MSTCTTEMWLPSDSESVLAMLTDPDAIARWAPIDFDVLELAGERLEAGSHARVCGALAGHPLEFDVEIHEAHERCLSLAASGPVSIDAQYQLRPAGRGSKVRASVSVSGCGILGTALARLVEAFLAAGALRSSIARIGRELDARPAPGRQTEVV